MPGYATKGVHTGRRWCQYIPSGKAWRPIHPCSLVGCGGKPAQHLYRWDEVIGPADSRRIPGQGITYAILCPRNTSEHARQAPLVATEADKHRSMLGGRPEWGIAAED